MKDKESDSNEPRHGGREGGREGETTLPRATQNPQFNLQPRPVRQRPRELAFYVVRSGKPAFYGDGSGLLPGPEGEIYFN